MNSLFFERESYEIETKKCDDVDLFVVCFLFISVCSSKK